MITQPKLSGKPGQAPTADAPARPQSTPPTLKECQASAEAPVTFVCESKNIPGVDPYPEHVADLNRRQVLAGGLALGVATVLGGSPPALASTDSRWADLRKLLPGRLIFPGDRGYAGLATPRNLRYAALMPKAVVECRDAGDIATAIAWARRTETPFALRGGGHNYADASSSTGIIISTRRMKRASMRGTTLRAQAGVQNSDLARLLPQGGTGTLLLPGGTCPNVGVVGLTLGGGIGPNAPWAGLTADRLRAATMVTATGDIVSTSARENPDLFWGLRGAAGGNFGAVTDLEYELIQVAVSKATTFSLDYPITAATETAMAWQQCRQVSQDVVGGAWSIVIDDTGPRARIRAQVLLPEADARAYMGPLLAVPRAREEIVERSWWDTYAWYRTPISPSNTFWDRSLYVESDLGSSVIDRLVSQLTAYPDPINGYGFLGISGWVGGRVRSVPADQTAYVHRRATALVEFSMGWPDPKDPRRWPTAVPPALRDWMTGLWEIVYSSTTGESYQNFADPGLSDPLAAYYGANLRRLIRVKRQWDPEDVFTYAQGIPARP